MSSFSDLLAAAVEQRQSQIVLGLDPDPQKLWPGSDQADVSDPREALAAATVVHCQMVIDVVAPACVAIKPQLACFERLGAPGWAALETVTAYAQQIGLLVIADGKRGDVATSAQAYREALEALGADAFTVNPLMGLDALEPFIQSAEQAAKGIFVLVRTSNPGAADVEDLELASGEPLWQRLAAIVAELGERVADDAALSPIGAVIGATEPAHLVRARELMPKAIFLLPGVGAQGGRVEELAPAFLPAKAGGLVTASRSIVNAHEQSGKAPAEAARVEVERLRELAWDLEA